MRVKHTVLRAGHPWPSINHHINFHFLNDIICSCILFELTPTYTNHHLGHARVKDVDFDATAGGIVAPPVDLIETRALIKSVNAVCLDVSLLTLGVEVRATNDVSTNRSIHNWQRDVVWLKARQNWARWQSTMSECGVNLKPASFRCG